MLPYLLPMKPDNSNIILPDELVISKIYYIRNHKVMLDKDLAELYDVKPTRLREQVKRNIVRFPANFMFQLTDEEVKNMVSQSAIPSRRHLGGTLPYAFTEHGVLRIIEIFVKMREMLSSHKDVLLKLEQLERKVTGHDDDIQLIFKYLKQLLAPPQEPRPKIGFRSR